MDNDKCLEMFQNIKKQISDQSVFNLTGSMNLSVIFILKVQIIWINTVHFEKIRFGLSIWNANE